MFAVTAQAVDSKHGPIRILIVQYGNRSPRCIQEAGKYTS